MPQIANSCICCGAAIEDKQSAILMPFVAKRALDWESCEITLDWGLRDVSPGHAHALGNTLHCHICGTIFLDMRFDDAEMERLYRGYRDETYARLREQFEPGYRSRNDRLSQGDVHIQQVELLLRPFFPSRPTILDWGGDTGLNTPFRHVATRHDVLDISDKPALANVRKITSADLSEQRYDLVVLSNVLEHIPHPTALLWQVVAHLGTGLLYVEVPFEPLMREEALDPSEPVWRRKRHWHEHVNFFSQRAMRTLLARCGLGIEMESLIELSDGGCQMAFLARNAP